MTQLNDNANSKTHHGEKPRYKLVPEDWKSLPTGRFRRAVSHIEAVLFEISADGTQFSHPANGQLAAKTLNRWADHLRAVLKELTTGL